MILARPAAERERHTKGSHDVVLEGVPATEVTVVEIVLDIDPEPDPAVVAATKSESQPYGASQIGITPVVIGRRGELGSGALESDVLVRVANRLLLPPDLSG